MSENRTILSPKIIRQILQGGIFNKDLIDVVPNRNNKDRSVFIFRNSIELEEYLSENFDI